MARSFNGSNQYLNNANDVVNSPPFSFAAWFKSDSATAAQALIWVGRTNSNVDNWNLVLRGDVAGDPVGMLAYDVTPVYAGTTSGYSTGTWHSAVGVENSNTDRRAYIDGGSKGTNSDDRTPDQAGRTALGAHNGSSTTYYLDGDLAEAAIWDASLSDAEAAMHGLGIAAPQIKPANLAAYWRLLRDEDIDIVGGFNMTAYNSPTVATHPPKVRYQVPIFVAPPSAAAPINIAMDALTLAGAAPTLTVTPGAVSLAMSALTLAGASPSMTVSPGAVSIAMDALALASGPQSLTVTPGAVAIVLDKLALAGAPLGLTVSPGAVSLAMDALTLAGSAQSLTVSLATTIALSALALAGSVPSLTVVPGAVTIAVDKLGITGAAQALNVSPGAVQLAMDALSITASPQALGVVPGSVAIALSKLGITGTAQQLSVSLATTIAMAALTLASTVESLTVVPGSVAVAMDALELVSEALALVVTSLKPPYSATLTDALAAGAALADALAGGAVLSDSLVGGATLDDTGAAGAAISDAGAAGATVTDD